MIRLLLLLFAAQLGLQIELVDRLVGQELGLQIEPVNSLVGKRLRVMMLLCAGRTCRKQGSNCGRTGNAHGNA